MGCPRGLQIDFTPADSWPAGVYEVVVVADKVTKRCTLTLPLDCDAATECSNESWTVITSGCMKSEQSVEGILFTGAPSSVKVTISSEGQTLGSGTYTPAYATTRPNGATCEPVCKSATVDPMAIQLSP